MNRLARPPRRTCSSTPTTRSTGGRGRRGVRRGPAAGRTGADLGRLRRLPLVPRDGPRVVRGRGGRRADQRRLRRDQGGPRGAARRRRRLHDRDAGDDRAGRLADDGLRHARRRPRSSAAPTSRSANFVRLLARRSPTAWRDAARGRARGRAPRWSRRSAAPRPSAARPRPLTAELLDAAADPARPASTTRRNGGFGGAPKFPPHMDLLFLLRHHQRTGSARGAGDRPAHRRGDGPRRHLRPARRRLRPLLGRRALDRAALREDALRQRAAAAGVHPAVAAHRRPAGRAGSPTRPPRSCSTTCGTPAGGFASALDADTDGVEGLTYAWTPAQLVEVLGEDDGGWAADLFGVTDEPARSSTAGACCGWPATSTTPTRTIGERWQRRTRPAAARPGTPRPQPARDDKVVAAWNGLAITALAEHAAIADRRRRVTPTDGGRRASPSVLGRPRAPGRRPAAPGLPRRRGRRAGRGAGGLRLRGRGVLRRAPAHRRRALAGAGRRRCSTSRWPGSPTGRRLLRHRRRRRAAGRPAGRPDRQRHPVGPVGDRGGAGRVLGADRRDRATARRPRRRWRRSRRSSAGTPAFAGTPPRRGEALLSGPYEIAIVTDDPAGDPLVAAAPGTPRPAR